jgi:hypothetical protein
MELLLLILLNATLFVRPAEIVPAVMGWPIYEVLILSGVAASGRAILRHLQPGALARQPITVCALGMLAAVLLSHLSHGFLWGAQASGLMFVKVVVYYLLVVAGLTSARRLRVFLLCLSGFIVVLTALALLQYHELINIPALEILQQHEYDPQTGEMVLIPRLRSTGIYNDPNDLSQILIVGILLCTCWLTDVRQKLWRWAWLAPLALFGYALALTQSRGGFLALLAGTLVLLGMRLGWRRTAVLAVLGLPVLFVLFAGRQTSLSTNEGTSQERIQLWSEGLQMFQQAPLFGIGAGQFQENAGLVAHNSYVHCYAELGLFGGTLFVGLFACALGGLWRLGKVRRQIADPGLRRLFPCMAAIVTAYAVGLFSLSRPYVMPTYLVFGLTAAYLRLAGAGLALPPLRFDRRLVRRLLLASAAALVLIYLFVRTFVRWG